MNNENFKDVLVEVYEEIAGPEGKGFQRHGKGISLENQPWVKITENVGDGFLLGQALKKIFELKGKDPEITPESYKAWRKEILGAIVYLTFAILWKDKKLDKKSNSPSTDVFLSTCKNDDKFVNFDDGN